MTLAPKIEIRVFFDAGSGICLWAGNDAARRKFQTYAVPPAMLPISAGLQSRIASLIERYDASMDWDHPTDPTPWTEAECLDFNMAAHEMIAQLTAELPMDYEIRNEFTPIQRNEGARSNGG